MNIADISWDYRLKNIGHNISVAVQSHVGIFCVLFAYIPGFKDRLYCMISYQIVSQNIL